MKLTQGRQLLAQGRQSIRRRQLQIAVEIQEQQTLWTGGWSCDRRLKKNGSTLTSLHQCQVLTDMRVPAVMPADRLHPVIAPAIPSLPILASTLQGLLQSSIAT